MKSTHLWGDFSTRGSLICEDDYSCSPLLTLRGISELSEENNIKPPLTSTRVHRASFIFDDVLPYEHHGLNRTESEDISIINILWV